MRRKEYRLYSVETEQLKRWGEMQRIKKSMGKDNGLKRETLKSSCEEKAENTLRDCCIVTA